MDSQQKIHELDLSGKSVSPIGQLDILLSDLKSKLDLILTMNTNDRESSIALLAAYIQDYRDGNRFFREDPYKNLNL
jgi:hypothetical protein